MDVIKYKVFLEAAEKGNFTAVAEAMGYTQSGVTRMVHALEEEVGFPLFVRKPSGVALTANGRLMLPKIRDVELGIAAPSKRELSPVAKRFVACVTSLMQPQK